MRILIIADTPGWAHDRRALALQKYAPTEFEVDVAYLSNGEPHFRHHPIDEYDLIFLLDYASWLSVSLRLDRESWHKPYVLSYNRDSQSKWWSAAIRPFIRQHYHGFVVINNFECFEHHGRMQQTCNISNGVDLDLWGVDNDPSTREPCVLWCGSANPKKGKGWDEVLKPLQHELDVRGIRHSFRPYDGSLPLSEWVYDTERQREWYNSGVVYVSASESEGTPNTILEAMACGCIPVCTPVGNILEMGVDGKNCVIVDRNVQSVMNGIERALANRSALSSEAITTIQNWSYGEPGHRAKVFFDLFHRLVEHGVESVQPFSYAEL